MMDGNKSFPVFTGNESGNLHEIIGELKTCPFCNGKAELVEHEGRIASGHFFAQVVCMGDCNQVSTNYAYGLDKVEAARRAAEYWNLRDGVIE